MLVSFMSATPGHSAAETQNRVLDVPLAWIFLLEDPVPTGAGPLAYLGAELPCGYRPVSIVSGESVSPVTLRVLAQYQGTGTPDPSARCPEAVRLVRAAGMQPVRVGTLTVVDHTPHGEGAPPAPSVTLHVVPDDATLPEERTRSVRSCQPGNDASCTAGGVCATLPGEPAGGVCVPPLDPYLHAHMPCRAPRVEVTLQHPAPYAMPLAPSGPEVHACLPSCASASECPAPLRCRAVGAQQVCTP